MRISTNLTNPDLRVMGGLEGLAELRREFRGLRTSTAGKQAWESFALKVFRFQVANVPPYGRFCELLGVQAASVQSFEDIPYLPVELFASQHLAVDDLPVACAFRSSGTTGSRPSVHVLDDPEWYAEVSGAAFQACVGDLNAFEIHALLPGYLERPDASLVHMVRDWLQAQGVSDVAAHFHLHDHRRLQATLAAVPDDGKVLLLGVTHALLDWAEGPQALSAIPRDWLIMETGGMKGRRAEWVRDEVHGFLKHRLGIDGVASEYGMTEMLSQAYALSEGVFEAPPWVWVGIRETDDPGNWVPPGRQGRICVADLANLHSCAFLATGDLGRIRTTDGRFEVLGRYDHAEVRGCNLMVAEMSG